MIGDVLKDARARQELKLKEISHSSGIDQTLISRFENGERMPTESQLRDLSHTLKLDFDELYTKWMAEKVARLIQYSPRPARILEAAEARVEYLRKGEIKEISVSDEIQDRLDTLDILKEKWHDSHPLNKTQLEKLNEYFDIAYTFESNRIEGNTLTLQETSLVVNQGLTIGGKSMREHLEAVNHIEAIDFIRGLADKNEPLTKRSLLEVHHLVLKGIDKENAGKYRTVPVRISGSEHVPPQPYLVDKLMEDFLYHYRLNDGALHPVILAAEIHERLVSIHPFIDGNGRTSRLLMNLILLSNGYTRANIKGDNKSRLAYYQALESVQMNNDPEPFYYLVIDEVQRSLVEHLELV